VSLESLARIDQALSLSSFTVHPSFIDGARDPTQTYFIAAENAPLWQAVVAGDLTNEHWATLHPHVPPVRQPHRFSVQLVRSEDEIARAQLRGGTLLEHTVAHFGECWASGGPSSFPALLWITQDDNLDDCLWFWNLRALRPLRFQTVPMVLLPFGEVQNWLGYAQQFTSMLASRTNSPRT
jgi:hypothetical protein